MNFWNIWAILGGSKAQKRKVVYGCPFRLIGLSQQTVGRYVADIRYQIKRCRRWSPQSYNGLHGEIGHDRNKIRNFECPMEVKYESIRFN